MVNRQAHLDDAEQHIADGERRLHDIRMEVGKLEQDGHPTEGAKNLLQVLEATLTTMIEYRRIILAEIAAGKP